ncbi:helix-turn-helix transcriptional regulator [Lysobacter sp. TAF61]|uniref:helix-turn-helix transcriptional regulator n=1 Tax=Lysobacter sp. TAF61 TaxID=3233072 RepID=UPI003F9C455E
MCGFFCAQKSHPHQAAARRLFYWRAGMQPHPQSQASGSKQRLVRLPEVIARTGISRSEVYRRMAAGTFPVAIKLGQRLNAWTETSVDEWIDAQIAARIARRPSDER